MEAFLDMFGLRETEELFDPSDIVLDYGKYHDWLSGNITRANTRDGKNWLNDEIHAYNNTESSDLNLPKWRDTNGNLRDYEIYDLTTDQQDILAYILNGGKRWLDGDPTFEGIRMIVHGKGGTGKTVLLICGNA